MSTFEQLFLMAFFAWLCAGSTTGTIHLYQAGHSWLIWGATGFLAIICAIGVFDTIWRTFRPAAKKNADPVETIHK